MYEYMVRISVSLKRFILAIMMEALSGPLRGRVV